MGAIDWELMAIRAFVLAIPLFVIACIVLAIRQLRMPFERKFRRAYAGLRISDTQEPGMVLLQFHTYDGFLAWFTQTSHVVFAPPDDARKLLRRLVRHNLTWGMLSAGNFFVPLLTYFNRRAQLQSVEVQEQAMREGNTMFAAAAAPPATEFADAVREKPSVVMRVAGYFMVFFALCCVIASVSLAIQQKWGEFLSMLALAYLFWTFAQEIPRPRG
jgi:hypothetical protein